MPTVAGLKSIVKRARPITPDRAGSAITMPFTQRHRRGGAGQVPYLADARLARATTQNDVTGTANPAKQTTCIIG